MYRTEYLNIFISERYIKFAFAFLEHTQNFLPVDAFNFYESYIYFKTRRKISFLYFLLCYMYVHVKILLLIIYGIMRRVKNLTNKKKTH